MYRKSARKTDFKNMVRRKIKKISETDVIIFSSVHYLLINKSSPLLNTNVIRNFFCLFIYLIENAEVLVKSNYKLQITGKYS